MVLTNRSIAAVVIGSLVLHAALLTLYVAKHNGDVTALVGASHAAVGRDPLESVTTSIGPGGYDGMFYYAIARNPWTPHTLGIDNPALRHVRILYPILCWLVSGGDALRLFWVMPAIQLIIIGALAWLGSWTAWKHGMSVAWGFVLPLAVNACIPALRDLTDNLSTLLVFALLVAWLFEAPWWSVTLLALAAVFAREQNVLVVGIVMLAAAWKQRYAVTSGLAATLAAWLAWATFLHALYGSWVFQNGSFVCGLPLNGFAYGWTHLGGFHHSTRLAIVNSVSLGHMALLLVVAVPAVLLGGSRALAVILLLSVVLAVFATDAIWNDLISYRRVLVGLPLGIWLAGIRARKTWLLWPLTPAGLFSLAATLRYV
jgi:hypothetical protein